jgi:hypothetical protein
MARNPAPYLHPGLPNPIPAAVSPVNTVVTVAAVSDVPHTPPLLAELNVPGEASRAAPLSRFFVTTPGTVTLHCVNRADNLSCCIHSDAFHCRFEHNDVSF